MLRPATRLLSQGHSLSPRLARAGVSAACAGRLDLGLGSFKAPAQIQISGFATSPRKCNEEDDATQSILKKVPPPGPVESTTFDGKASPHKVRNMNRLRGLPGKAPPHAPKDAAAGTEGATAAASAATATATAAGAASATTTAAPKAGVEGKTGSAERPKPSSEMESEMYSGPSRPRPIYSRPARDLPIIKNRVPLYIALAALGLGAWGLFVFYATNNERLSSSVVRQILFQLRNSPEVQRELGDGVRLEPTFYGGNPWISGGINLMQGRIDLKFRMQGSRDCGTLYFTSIRPQQAAPWQILRYKLIADSGAVVRLEDTAVRPTP